MEIAMTTELKDVERQITGLAARVDPIAFQRGADASLEDRRRAALHGAAERLRQVQAYLGVTAGVAIIVGFVSLASTVQ
jgi:hypothetical protein